MLIKFEFSVFQIKRSHGKTSTFYHYTVPINWRAVEPIFLQSPCIPERSIQWRNLQNWKKKLSHYLNTRPVWISDGTINTVGVVTPVEVVWLPFCPNIAVICVHELPCVFLATFINLHTKFQISLFTTMNLQKKMLAVNH